ncbi:hypothetical protein FACS1894130_06310 [Spirochaetia bacterium]|nr:hypothetical protein FACS1894130_06310 [Spirochaetia bacterium]
MSAANQFLYSGSFQPQFKTSFMGDTDINGSGDGIYTYSIDDDTGELSLVHNTYGIINPAHLHADLPWKRLYAASDTNEFLNWEHGTGGGVYMFAIEESGKLTLLDKRSSCGVRAVDICGDSSGKYIIVVNEASVFYTTEFVKNNEGKYAANIRYDEGCVVLFRVDDGCFKKVCDRYVLPQGTPAHPSSITIDKDNYIYIRNRGGRTINIMKLDPAAEKLIPVSSTELEGEPDGFALHPNFPIFYVSQGGSGKILIYRYNADRTTISLVTQVLEEEPSDPAVIIISKDGMMLYAVDRVRAEIKAYGITQDGKLVLLQRLSDAFPIKKKDSIYEAGMDQYGKWLYLSNVQENFIHVYIVAVDGRLSRAADIPAPAPTGILVPGR